MKTTFPVLILRLGEQRVEHAGSCNHATRLNLIVIDVTNGRGVASQLQFLQPASPVTIGQTALAKTRKFVDTSIAQSVVHAFGHALLFLVGKGRLDGLSDVLVTLVDDSLHPRLCTQDGLNHRRVGVADVAQMVSQLERGLVALARLWQFITHPAVDNLLNQHILVLQVRNAKLLNF